MKPTFSQRSFARRPPISMLGWWMIALLCGPVSAQEKVTFQDHILPLVDNHCARCHNADKKRGDLDLTSYSSVLAGGASGVVVVAGDPDSSKLNRVISHLDEPKMPPNKPPLPGKELTVFRKWIEGGLLESAGSKAVVAARPAVDISVGAVAMEKPSGPPPMPPELPLEPVNLTSRGDAVLGVASSPWAPLVALTGQKQVLLYHTETFELLGILPFAEGQATSLQFSRNGTMLVVGGGQPGKTGRTQIWNIPTGDHVSTIGEDYDTILACDISPDQKWIATGGPDRIVKIYSTETGALVQRFKKHTDWILAAEFSPDGKYLATADRQGGLVVWEVASNQPIFTLTGHKKAVTALSWRRDAKILASISEDETVRTWEMKEGQQVKTWTAHKRGGLSVAFAPNGDLATCGRDGAVVHWAGDGRKIRSFEGAQEFPVRVTFTHDGSGLIASDWTGRVHAWKIKQGKPAAELDSNPPSLAARIAQAEAALTKAKGTSDSAELERAQNELQRWQLAATFAPLYRARKELHSAETKHAQLTEQAKRIYTESEELKKKLSTTKAKTEKTEIKSALTVLRLEGEKTAAALKEVSRRMKSESLKVEKLAADYERLKSLSPRNLSNQSASLTIGK